MLILLFALGLLLTPSLAFVFDVSTICTLVVNGTKMNDPRACNKWIQCIDGQPIAGSCDAGFFYDRESKDCVASTDVTCLSSNPCAIQLNGFAADPYSCNGYYYCKNGVGTHGECNVGMNYNSATEACIRDFPCPAKGDPDSVCNILPDGVFLKESSSCNGWEMCWKDEVVTGNCPGLFFFSAAVGECDYPQNVECAFTEPPPQTAQPDLCPTAGGFVSDQETCDGYYYCSKNAEGQMVVEHGDCSNGRFFYDDHGGACVPRSNIVCNYDRCAGLGYTTIELANESDDGCTGFSICQNGTKIGEGLCPNGQYFDELSQLCTTEVISYLACSLSQKSTTQIGLRTMMDDDGTTLE